jgi:hypothetical protein
VVARQLAAGSLGIGRPHDLAIKVARSWDHCRDGTRRKPIDLMESLHSTAYFAKEENKDPPIRLTLPYSILPRLSPVQNAMVVVDKFAIIRLDDSNRERSPSS